MSFTAQPQQLPLEDFDFADTFTGAEMIREERSKWQPLLLGIPLVAATVSALAGGIPFLTDFAFLLLAIFCAIFMIAEFRAFSFRWGIGGLVIFGGTLVWYCQDYFTNFGGRALFGGTGSIHGIPYETLARAAAHHMLFVLMMVLGMRIRLGGKLEGLIAKFPEPGQDRLYIVLFLTMFAFGMSPYFFFTVDGPLVAFWNDLMNGRSGGAVWTIGRDGNVNYSYGAYIAQVLQVAQMASVLAGFYAVYIAKGWTGRIIGLLIWLPSAALGFGSGTRGALVVVALPLVGFVFIKFQSIAAARLKRVSFRGYMMLTGMLFLLLLLVQVQITFRGSGFREADVGEVLDKPIQGNGMYSESLTGFYIIPKFLDPFYTKFPGQSMIMPVPDAVYWFFISPMPRAVWKDKPIDPVWQWYNNTVAGTTGTEGTTISQGGVGYWYFRFGLWGTIQGGLFMGFLTGMTERLLREYSPRKPILILVSLGFATFLFRCFRGLQWMEFHGTLVGLVALGVAITVLRVFLGGNSGGYGQQSEAEGRG